MVAKEIARAMRAAASLVASGGKDPGKSILATHRKNMTKILARAWRESGVAMAENIAGAAKNYTRIARKADDTTDIPLTEIADRIMADWINSVGAQEVANITDTTRDDVRVLITRGVSEGLSEKEIAANIRELAPFRGGSRAQTIARTETHTAGNVAAFGTADATGIKFDKVWISAKNERTRKTHKDADGQRVPMGKPFTVGGAKLMYPSDHRGPAREVINCRCAVSYVIAK